MIRRKWVRPKLIVLLRGTPQEMVLEGCKNNLVDGPNYAGQMGVIWYCSRTEEDFNNCIGTGGTYEVCIACQLRPLS